MSEEPREVIRQESFWFTATTLTFTGFVVALVKEPSITAGIIALSLISILGIFTIYLLIGRYKDYCRLNGQELSNWWVALRQATKEGSGTLYCVGVVVLSTCGCIAILLMRMIDQLCRCS